MDFLQSDICKQVVSNKLKIHVETGNITMTTKTQTNQFSNFFFKQQDLTKGIIDFEFFYSGSYVEYFNWLIEGFDSYQKTKLDVLASKNAKCLFYRLMIF